MADVKKKTINLYEIAKEKHVTNDELENWSEMLNVDVKALKSLK